MYIPTCKEPNNMFFDQKNLNLAQNQDQLYNIHRIEFYTSFA